MDTQQLNDIPKKVDKRSLTSKANAIKAQEGRKRKAIEQKELLEKYRSMIPQSDTDSDSDEEIIYVGPRSKSAPIAIQKTQQYDNFSPRESKNDNSNMKKELDEIKQMMMLMSRATTRKRTKKIIIEKEKKEPEVKQIQQQMSYPQPIIMYPPNMYPPPAQAKEQNPHKELLAKKILNF